MKLLNIIRLLCARLLNRYSKLFSRRNLDNLLLKSLADMNLPETSFALNIGAGGELGSILTRYFPAIKQLDLDEKRNPDFLLSVEDMYLIKDESMDVVFCLEVLEHVRNPGKAISEISRVLKPGGRVVGSTPFIFPIHDAPNDYYRFTEHGVRYLFDRFREEQLQQRNGFFASIYVLLCRSLLQNDSPYRLLRSVALFPLVLLLLPLFLILNLLTRNNFCTTGYFYIFSKIE